MDSINRIIVDGVEIEPVYKKKRGIVLLRQVDDMVYVSGHGPEDQITGKPLFQGRIGKDLTLEEGYAAARECAIIILGALKDTFGSLDNIRIIKAFGLVNCAEEFLEERGYHARTVMGTHNLPNGNIPVEIEVIAEVR